jgi:hypothetical protein
MRLQPIPIGLIKNARSIVFAAVQFSEPSLSTIKSNSTLEWDPQQREQRVRDAKSVIEALFSGAAAKRPDVVVFAEYSLPAIVHRENYFHNVADKNRAIIVAGSHFQPTAVGEGGFDICKIYIPDETEPILICKARVSTPDKYNEFIKATDQFPNIARLILHPTDAPRSAAINVFLSSDFLAPFNEKVHSDHHQDSSKVDYISLLDWEREGINIAITNSYEPALFQGAALLDNSSLHGKPKLVLLVSSANDGQELATALFSPSTNSGTPGHVAAQLPPAMQGVLLIEANLWDVYDKTENKIAYQVSHRAYRYDAAAPDRLVEYRQESKSPGRRGIFHPALLVALQKYIVLEMFVARSTLEVNRAFLEGAIRHVNASHVRGIEDVLIKKYVADGTLIGTRIPGLSVPHSYLSAEGFRAAFEEGELIPHLKVLLEPRGTLKFRGKGIPPLNDDDWKKLCKSISRTAGRFGAIDEIISLAKRIPQDGGIDEKYRDIFIGIEPITPVGTESANPVRESYLLISTKTAAGASSRERFRDYIRDRLIDDVRVRDIYAIADTYMTPEPEGKRNKFEFLLRLKCTVFEADKILEGIYGWGESAGVQVGTRSYDVWKSILRDSLGSIGDRISTEGLSLLSALLALSKDARWRLEPQLREKFAKAIERNAERLDGARTDEAENLKQAMKDFYYNVCLHSICAKKPTDSRYQRDAKSCLTDLYGYVESGARELLTHALNVPSDSDIREIKKALGARIGKAAESQDTNLVRLLGQYYTRLLDCDANDLASLIRDTLEQIAPLRNDWVHHNQKKWSKAIFLPEENWELQFVELDKKIGIICNLIAETAKELDERGLS